MTDAPTSTECAVWYLRWGHPDHPDYDLADTEREAADLAAGIEASDDGGTIEGVQFADGRTIKAADWTELHAARERRRAAESQWMSRPPVPTRSGRDPFSGKAIEVETDSPAWVGA